MELDAKNGAKKRILNGMNPFFPANLITCEFMGLILEQELQPDARRGGAGPCGCTKWQQVEGAALQGAKGGVVDFRGRVTYRV